MLKWHRMTLDDLKNERRMDTRAMDTRYRRIWNIDTHYQLHICYIFATNNWYSILLCQIDCLLNSDIEYHEINTQDLENSLCYIGPPLFQGLATWSYQPHLTWGWDVVRTAIKYRTLISNTCIESKKLGRNGCCLRLWVIGGEEIPLCVWRAQEFTLIHPALTL